MATTLQLFGVWFHEPDDLTDYLYIPWSEGEQDRSIELAQDVNVQGFTRIRRTPGARNSYSYSFRGLSIATINLLRGREARLQYMRDSRGIATYGMFGSTPVSWWPNPRIGDVEITFLETSKEFVQELITV